MKLSRFKRLSKLSWKFDTVFKNHKKCLTKNLLSLNFRAKININSDFWRKNYKMRLFVIFKHCDFKSPSKMIFELFFCIFCRAVNPFLFNYWVHPSVSLNVLGFLTNKRPALKTALRLCQRLPKLELLSFQLTWNCKLPICSPKLPSKCDMPPSGCKNPDAELIVTFLLIGKFFDFLTIF